MPNCVIVTCNNRSQTKNYKNNGVTYHIFPKNPTIKEKWIDATGRRSDWFPVTRSVICSDHFQEKCFQPLNKSRRLFEWATPTLKICQIVSSLSAPPPPQQQQQFIDAQPGPSSAAPENQNDSDFDEREVGVITEQQTGLEDPLANNSDHQCRFCAKNANNSINPTDKPYSKDNKISLTLNDIHVEIDLNDTHKVCLDCDRKLSEWFNFVGIVKNAQDALLNASFDEETETLVVKTECESPTADDNDKINEDAKEETVDSVTIDETAVKDVFTHKKRKCNKDTQRTTKRQKKPNVEDTKLASEDTELIINIKEEPTEKDDDATYIHKSADSDDNTGPDEKPSELEIATNALLNEMADDGFS